MDNLYKKLNEKDKQLKEIRMNRINNRESLNKEDLNFDDSIISNISNPKTTNFLVTNRFNDRETSRNRYEDKESLKDYLLN